MPLAVNGFANLLDENTVVSAPTDHNQAVVADRENMHHILVDELDSGFQNLREFRILLKRFWDSFGKTLGFFSKEFGILFKRIWDSFGVF